MTTYWHIAWDGYQAGTDLICRADQAAAGIESPWTWDDADDGFDADVICLFDDTEQGRQEADWLWYERPTYALLRIEVPADTDRAIVHVAEGYPAMYGHIPADWITVVATTYTEGAIA
jgi:hypothetical protein